jgi:hypothetical protein
VGLGAPRIIAVVIAAGAPVAVAARPAMFRF